MAFSSVSDFPSVENIYVEPCGKSKMK